MVDDSTVRYVPGLRGLELLNEAGIRISKGSYYSALNSGVIPSVRIGNRYFVPIDVVERMGDKSKGESG